MMSRSESSESESESESEFELGLERKEGRVTSAGEDFLRGRVSPSKAAGMPMVSFSS